MFDFKDKTILITGAANGLGKAMAIEFYKQGSHLALLDIDFAGLQRLKSEIENQNQRITIHQTDVSKIEQVIAAKQAILRENHKIDILINNAGVSISQPFEQMSLEDFNWLFNINFWGTIYCTKHFLPVLKLQKESKIVNIISMFSTMGFPGKSAYSCSKAAIQAFSNCLKSEFADSQLKISYVIPPAINTGIILNGKHINADKKIREAIYLDKNGMTADWVAHKIIAKIKKDKYKIVIGTKTYWIDMISRIFPAILQKLINKNKEKFDFV